MLDHSLLTGSARNLAVTYGLVSGAWILSTDRLVFTLFDEPERVTHLQTAKGWLFVAGSTLLIFLLVRHGRRDLERTNERLDEAVAQTTVLHRILRHNLRNACNVIQGNAQLLEERVDEDDRIGAIEEQTTQLQQITEKTRLLRTVVLDDPSETDHLDVVAIVDSRVEHARKRYPHAKLRTEAPATAHVETTPRIADALDELIENAVEHGDVDEPTVTVSVQQGADAVTIEIEDDGPGMPEMEADVLHEGVETPTFHSEGLGLWIARTVVSQVDGEFEIDDAEPRGTVVRMTLREPPSTRHRRAPSLRGPVG